jgi:hypothetical protein
MGSRSRGPQVDDRKGSPGPPAFSLLAGGLDAAGGGGLVGVRLFTVGEREGVRLAKPEGELVRRALADTVDAAE